MPIAHVVSLAISAGRATHSAIKTQLDETAARRRPVNHFAILLLCQLSSLPYFPLHLLIITNPVKVLAVRSINLGQSVEGKHHSATCILVYVCALIVAFVRLAAICALLDNCISAL